MVNLDFSLNININTIERTIDLREYLAIFICGQVFRQVNCPFYRIFIPTVLLDEY